MTLLGTPCSPRALRLIEERYAPRAAGAGGSPLIACEHHRACAQALRDELDFLIFGFVVATHYPVGTLEGVTAEVIRLSYGLRSPGKGSELASWQLEVPVPGKAPTISDIFAGADWQEREQFDLLGVGFTGHPDLRRIMLPEDWDGHPLRKDYALNTSVAPWR